MQGTAMNQAGKQTARGVIVAFFTVSAVFCLATRSTNRFEVQVIAAEAGTARPNYSDFQHSTKAHRMECGTCHKFPSANWNKVRDDKTAFPDITEYPRHESCLKCHSQQFFKGARPAICSVCHTDPSPRNSVRHPFPNPREKFDLSTKGQKAQSDFVVGFPHDKHIEIVSAPSTGVTAQKGEESCAACHETMTPQGKSDDEYLTKPPPKLGDGFWLKKGTFKTAPIGHETCFTCHSADTGILPAPNNCAACHQLKSSSSPADQDARLAVAMGIKDRVTLDAWRSRHSTGTFRHEWFSHAELSCATCHNVAAINTTDALTKKVSIASCATCHATATSDDGGALNFEIDSRQKNAAFQCVKCHVTFGKMPVPASHTKALATATGK
jgi:hypothetical protein